MNKLYVIITRPGLSEDLKRTLSGIIKILSHDAICEVISALDVELEKGELLSKYNNIPHQYVIAFGGDGTFATAARLAVEMDTSVIGVQAGNLNFLNAFTPDDFTPDFNPTSLKTSRRITGWCDSLGERFINDAVMKVNKGTGLFNISDGRGRSITSFRGDGVVISTATGSTAYNLSLGGPILHPTSEMFVITPIAAMAISARPIVIPTDEICVTIDQSSGTRFMDVLFDGLDVSLEQRLTIDVGPRVEVLLPWEYNFYEQANKKLGWFS